MRRSFSALLAFVLLIILAASTLTAAQRVDIGAAKRAAEYHGEALYEKDLKVCDHELLRWAWGEPAVYVFTLMREDDAYPADILKDETLLRGAYLVSTGKKRAGYAKMAQAGRYWTVFVGATTDMPSFLKAYAGLPEHIVAQPLMDHCPADPYWIYGDLFHILVASRSAMARGEAKAVEIHRKETCAISDLGGKKSRSVPASLEQTEWERFTTGRAVPAKEEAPAPLILKAALEGWHQLTVEELNTDANWRGCGPAAFFNCLKYLEKRKKVKTHGESANTLMDWISICFNTRCDEKWWCEPKDMKKGAIQFFRGCGYSSAASIILRNSKDNLGFFDTYADEINKRFPCLLGGGTGDFKKHEVTGIGYYKKGAKLNFVIHDTWEETPEAVLIPFSGYPVVQLPDDMVRIRPQGTKQFEAAVPIAEEPILVGLDKSTASWKWQDIISSQNEVKVKFYGHEFLYYDKNGVRYKIDESDHIYGFWDFPYRDRRDRTCSTKEFKEGTVQEKFYLIDDNGHLLVIQKTVRLCVGETYLGSFRGSLKGYILGNKLLWFKDDFDMVLEMVVAGKGTPANPYSGGFGISGTGTELNYTGGPLPFSVQGIGTVAGSNGRVEASLRANMIDPSYGPIDCFQGSFTGTKGAVAISGEMKFDYSFTGMTTEAPIVKTVALVNPNKSAGLAIGPRRPGAQPPAAVGVSVRLAMPAVFLARSGAAVPSKKK